MIRLAAFLLIACCGVAMPAAPQAAPVQLAQHMPDIGVDRATSIARGRVGGRVLGVRRLDVGGRVVYEVRLLMDGGVVRTVMVDAASGAVW